MPTSFSDPPTMNDAPLELEQLNARAHELAREALQESQSLDITQQTIGGATVVDFASDRAGTNDAGIYLSKICLGGDADVALEPASSDLGLEMVHVSVPDPLPACIGAQYAGWPVSHDKYFAMCSGPIRLRRGKEPILLEYDLQSSGKIAVGVLEASQLPSESVIQHIAQECGVSTEGIVLCVARTASIPGSLQVVARSVETSLHKLHELKFDLSCIVSGTGTAPLPPIAKDDMTALGWTNDSVLYGANVELTVDTSDEAIQAIIEQVPSCSSTEFGTPFLEIFKRFEYDFYKIDKMLFSPAKVVIHNQQTGNTFAAGEIRNDVLRQSFGIQ